MAFELSVEIYKLFPDLVDETSWGDDKGRVAKVKTVLTLCFII